MDMLRIAGAALNQVPLDWEGNSQRIIQVIQQAKEKKVAAICFPELSISGYNCEDMFLSLHTARQSMDCLLRICDHTMGIMAIVGLPVYFHGTMYNCAAVLQNGKVLGIIPKKVLPRSGVHYEPRWFRVWHPGELASILIENEAVPFGDLRFQFGKLGLGVEICEEAWDSAGATAQAIAGTEIIMNPSASHFALGKYKTRETLVANASRAMQVHYLYTNLLGLEDGRIVFDGGVLLGECGEITARGKRFGFEETQLLIHDVDLDFARVGKLNNRSFEHEAAQQALPHTIYGDPFEKVKLPSLDDEQKPVDVVPYAREDEFLQAEMLGLFDYLRKTRSQGYLVSLSGGCDSATCAVLIAHMVAEAHRQLGGKALKNIFGFAPSDIDDAKSWIQRILTTVYQGTAQSGAVTLDAAKSLSRAIGAEFHELGVQDIVETYVGHAEKMLGRKLSWEEDDISLQNIQARARAPMAWLLANLKNAVLVATSNRSEAAVGYATMDGDTAGGISPLAGIDKYFLLGWLKWAEVACATGLGPIAELKKVTEQQPTAELRPQGAGQTDEQDLMPYDILDAIESHFVRDRMSPDSVLDKLEHQYPHLDEADLKAYLVRFLELWSKNQWKRERYAPSFHLDDQSLDPKSWCRFPILSAGFAKEIRELGNAKLRL